MTTLESKLPNVGLTIFTTMTNLANTHEAINLSQGFPDFDVDPELIGLVEKYMRQGLNQYAPMQGLPALRKKIAEKVRNLYGTEYDPDTEITITSGGTEALFAAITTIVRTGDEVMLFDPAYDSYVPAIELSGGKPVHLKLTPPEYGFNWDEVEDHLSDKTRLIIINFPHNPSGAVLKPADIEQLKQIVEKYDLYILSDEVYEHIIFDGLSHLSMAGVPELAQRSFVVSSFGKTYHTTGWKIGYCLAPKDLTAEFRKVHQYLTFSSNTAIQAAYAEFLENENAYLRLPEFYQEKRDFFVDKIKGSRFKVIPSHGSFFQLLDYSDISDMTDTAYAEKLIIDHKVAAIPPSVFYKDQDDFKVLRFCFAKKNETLEEAAERLSKV
ncbi:MAG: methionine aminotransferase [Desulfobacteraceae bacterium]